MKVLILNDGSNYSNWGIKACIDGLFQIVNLIESDVEIQTLSHGFMHRKFSFEPKMFGRRVFLYNNRIANRFFKEFHKLPKVADEFDRVADKWMIGKGGRGAREFIKMAEDADLIIFNAEGSTYKNNIGAIKGLFMLWFAKTKLNKKAAFINGSVTLTAVDAVLPAMIKKTFGAIDLVSVREPVSQRNILEFYPELKGKILMHPDSVFALETVTESVNIDLPEEFFVFSRSMLPMDNKGALVDLINKLKNVVPNAVLMAKDSEDQVLRGVAKATGSVFIGPGFSYDQIQEILYRAKFLVSGRYHHLIFATKVGCPVIPMNTSSHKIKGLVELFGDLIGPTIDPTDLYNKSEAIIKRAKGLVAGDTGERLLDRAKELQSDGRGYRMN